MKGREALVVEDELLIAMDAERILREMGFAHVRIASTLHDAHEALHRAAAVGLVLLDLGIGEQSALPLLDELRRKGVVVVVTTGSSGLTEVGCTPVVAKPYGELDLLDAVARAFAQGRCQGSESSQQQEHKEHD